MIRKIILGLFLLCLFIAIPLATVGIRHVELGPAFIGFMNQTSKDLQAWKLTIPDIPNIPDIDFKTPPNGFVEVLTGIFQGLMSFINIIITIINVFIGMLNMVIQFTQYVFTLLKNLIAFTDTLKRIGSYQSPNLLGL